MVILFKLVCIHNSITELMWIYTSVIAAVYIPAR